MVMMINHVEARVTVMIDTASRARGRDTPQMRKTLVPSLH